MYVFITITGFLIGTKMDCHFTVTWQTHKRMHTHTHPFIYLSNFKPTSHLKCLKLRLEKSANVSREHACTMRFFYLEISFNFCCPSAYITVFFYYEKKHMQLTNQATPSTFQPAQSWPQSYWQLLCVCFHLFKAQTCLS